MAAKTPKQKGTEWESAIRDYLQRHGWPTVERLPLTGSRDRGDLAGIPGLVVEAKAARTLELGSWLNEAEHERVNARAEVGVVWAKRLGRAGAGEGFVVMTGDTFVKLLRKARF